MYQKYYNIIRVANGLLIIEYNITSEYSWTW